MTSVISDETVVYECSECCSLGDASAPSLGEWETCDVVDTPCKV